MSKPNVAANVPDVFAAEAVLRELVGLHCIRIKQANDRKFFLGYAEDRKLKMREKQAWKRAMEFCERYPEDG